MGNVLLGELPWSEVEKRLKVDKTVIVPIGATESYGRHLPLGTDFLVVAEIAKRLGEMTDTLVLPVLPFGDSSDMMGFPGTISLKSVTVLSVLKDVCELDKTWFYQYHLSERSFGKCMANHGSC